MLLNTGMKKWSNSVLILETTIINLTKKTNTRIVHGTFVNNARFYILIQIYRQFVFLKLHAEMANLAIFPIIKEHNWRTVKTMPAKLKLDLCL